MLLLREKGIKAKCNCDCELNVSVVYTQSSHSQFCFIQHQESLWRGQGAVHLHPRARLRTVHRQRRLRQDRYVIQVAIIWADFEPSGNFGDGF